MKLVTLSLSILAGLFISVSAHAAKECASSESQIDNIAEMTSQADPFGTWTGMSGAKSIVITLSKNSKGAFVGVASFDGQNFGPLGLKLCDYNGVYSFTISFFNVEFEVLSEKKIKIHYSLDPSSDTVILTKK